MSIEKFSHSDREAIEYIQKLSKDCVTKLSRAVKCDDPSLIPAFVIDWESVLALGNCTL